MKVIALALGIALLTQHCFLVTCQDSSEESNLEDVLKENYKACSGGYCVPSSHCLNGIINTDGVNIVEVRMNDYDDYIDVNPEEPKDSCEFLQTCCALGGVGNLPAPAPVTSTTTEGPIAEPPATCGTNRPKGFVYRVQNEGTAQIGEFPWMVSLLQRKTVFGAEKLEYFCGGSLIHAQVVLTAAHCMQPLADNLDAVVARLGEWDSANDNEPIIHQQYGIRKMVIHENYVDQKFHNDVALLIMADAAEFNVNINPICLPSKDDNFDEQRCLVSGWGKENFNAEGQYAEVLKRIELPVVPRNECKRLLKATKLGPFFQLHKSFMCAGGEAGVDTCKGDGGSPLACQSDDHYVQAGIVAWGLGCGEANVPGAYVNVANFVEWINARLQEDGIIMN